MIFQNSNNQKRNFSQRAHCSFVFFLLALGILSSGCAIEFYNVNSGSGSDSASAISLDDRTLRVTYPPRSGRSIGPASESSVTIQGVCTDSLGSVIVTGSLSTAISCSGSAFNTTLDFSSLSEGTVTLYFTQSTTTRMRKFTIDRTCNTAGYSTNAPFATASAGNQSDPHIICTATQLNQLNAFAGDYFELKNDIDYGGSTFTRAAAPQDFDGNHFEISDLVISNSGQQGMFEDLDGYIHHLYIDNWSVTSSDNYAGTITGTIVSNGKIDHVYVNNSTVNGSSRVGGLVGSGSSGLCGGAISNSTFQGNVTGGSITGGIVGYLLCGTLNNVEYLGGTVQGDDGVGGVIGRMTDSAAMNLRSTGTVIATVGGNSGGVLGWGSRFLLTNCHSDVTLNLAGIYAGGIFGFGNGSVDNCHYSGSITTTVSGIGGVGGYLTQGKIYRSSFSGSIVSTGDHVGGIVGYFGNGAAVSNIIEESYSSGTVTGGNNVGGLVGYGAGGFFLHSYSTSNVTGDDNVGGLIGRETESSIHPVMIYGSYAAGSVSINVGVNEGALIGEHVSSNATAYMSYYDTDTLSAPSTLGSGIATNDFTTSSNLVAFNTADGVWQYSTATTTNQRPILRWQQPFTVFEPSLSDRKIGFSNEQDFYISGTCATDTKAVLVYDGSQIEISPCTNGFWSLYKDFTEVSSGTVTLSIYHEDRTGVDYTSATSIIYDRTCATSNYATVKTFPEGDGSALSPYLICNRFQMANIPATITSDATSNFIFGDNIYSGGFTYSPSATSLSGNINGNGYLIDGFSTIGAGRRGLVNATTGNISNLRMMGVYSESSDDSAASVAVSASGNLSDIKVYGSIVDGVGTVITSGVVASVSGTTVDTIESIGNFMTTENGSIGGAVGSVAANATNIKFRGYIYVEGSTCVGTVGGIAGSIGLNGYLEDSFSSGVIFVDTGCNGNIFGGGVGNYGTWAQNVNNNESHMFIYSLSTGANGVGGFLGSSSNFASGSMSGNRAYGSVSGYQNTGGFVGVGRAMMTQSSFIGVVIGNNASGDNVGGFIGNSIDAASAITRSFAIGRVLSLGDNVGGFAGNLTTGSIETSMADVMVTGNEYVAGFYGDSATASDIEQSYARGKVIAGGANEGEFGGRASTGGGGVNDSYYNSNSGGPGADPAGTDPISNVNMQIQGSYVAFDFSIDWKIDQALYLYAIPLWWTTP